MRFREQQYDFSCGELTTRLDFQVNDATARIAVITFCSRTKPTLALQEVRVEVDRPCACTLRACIDPTGLPGRCLYRCTPNRGWLIADGSFHWEASGGLSTCGAAYVTKFHGDDKVSPKRDFWGYESILYTDYSFTAQPGKTYILHQVGSLVPSLMHGEPEREAIRLVYMGIDRGFENLRADNRAAWAELWQGRVKLLGAEERWQNIADSAYFHLHSSVHPSMPASVAPWGVGRRYNYLGHVFWDCETYIFPPVLLTAPHSARALMEYRAQRLQAARWNAALKGYRGVQFPWESGVRGEEEVVSWGSGGFSRNSTSAWMSRSPARNTRTPAPGMWRRGR